MGNEYRAKVFKSGNSVALRLPKALGLVEGTEMMVREQDGDFIVRRTSPQDDMIDLTGIFGSVPGISRPPCDDDPRDWPTSDHD